MHSGVDETKFENIYWQSIRIIFTHKDGAHISLRYYEYIIAAGLN